MSAPRRECSRFETLLLRLAGARTALRLGDIVTTRFLLGEVATSLSAIVDAFPEAKAEQEVLSNMINGAEDQMWVYIAGSTMNPSALKALENDIENMFKRLMTLYVTKCRAGPYRGPEVKTVYPSLEPLPKKKLGKEEKEKKKVEEEVFEEEEKERFE